MSYKNRSKIQSRFRLKTIFFYLPSNIANQLNDDIHTYWKEHFSYDAVKMMTNPRLVNVTSDGYTTHGAYYFNIHGNDGFMCDREVDPHIDQHTANLLCQSVNFIKAEEKTSDITGWYTKGNFSHTFCQGINDIQRCL